MEAKDRILVAMDVGSSSEALDLVDELKDHVGGFKIGLEFVRATLANLVTMSHYDAGVELDLVRRLYAMLRGVYFDDAKLSDIPNTIAGAVRGIVPLQPWAFNVHASAGLEAIKAAVVGKGESLVLGVTVLTSLDDECESIFGAVASIKVPQFAGLLVDGRADGIICSAKDLEYLRMDKRAEAFAPLLKATPAIRPKWAAAQDQKRITTPTDAIILGATHLVVGRPITQPPESIGSRVRAAELVAEEIETALARAV